MPEKLFLILLLLVCAALCLPRLDPLVDTGIGLIRGLQASDGDYSMFLGIPYAKVNESNPFGTSLPHPRFDEVFEAYDDSVTCPQFSELTHQFTGSLECLNLNIYVPNKAIGKNLLPVLLWIYGGNFQIGFAGRVLYGPKYLVRNEVILVTVNYRVGPYGFMCLGTADVPGNQGFKDQLLALRWIRDNIAAFGGDRDKVTLFGQSAGAAAVDYHVLSAQERLFDKAIIQSGSTLTPWAIKNEDSGQLIRIARRLGLETEDIDDALAFLATVEPKLVITTALEASIAFSPCVEREFEGVERFIAEHPIKSAVPKAKSVLVLAGYNSDEMLTSRLLMTAKSCRHLDVFSEILKLMFDLGDDRESVALMRQFYVGDEDACMGPRQELIDFVSDLVFNHPMHRSVQRHLKYGGKIYQYLFCYSGGRNFIKHRINVTDYGAAHADELGYLFDMTVFKEGPSEKDQLVIDRMTTMWANFVKYGDPTPVTSELLPVKWTPATADNLSYLNIDNDLTLKKRPFHHRMTFWDLFYKANIKFVKGYEGGEG